MIVTDASVLTNVLVYSDDRGRAARAFLGRDVEWVAPEHWKAEVFSAVRGLVLGGKVTAADGLRAVRRLPRLAVEVVPLDHLLDDMWRLRSAIGGYDAAYVVAAAHRDVTLMTADARLARGASQHCRVQYVA